MFSKYKRNKIASADINMTPMIDIVFQLLIFFMITSTFIQTASISVNLPESSTSDAVQEQLNTVTIHKDGAMEWNEESIDAEQLASRLQSLQQSDPNAVLVIQGDEGIAYGALISVMDKARAAGLTRLSLATVLR